MENKKNFAPDKEFEKIKTIVSEKTKEELIIFIGHNYNRWVRQTPNNIVKGLLSFYNTYLFWGKLDPKENNMEMIEQRADILKNRWNSIEKLYFRLEDYRSKYVFLTVLNYWLTFSNEMIFKVKERCYKSYFDMDLISCDEQEVMVDMGAFQGDTIEEYMETYGEECFSKIYAYEIVEENVKVLEEKFEENEKIIIRPVGVSKENGSMYLNNNGAIDAQSLAESGDKKVEIVTLDSDITEKITLLKADIEGAEKDAIIGAQNHIRNDRPKLALSIYHSNADLIDIFELIEEIQPGYHFYLRYNGREDFPTDYILIGIL